MSITERLANLTIPQVLIIVAVLAAIRLLMPRLNKEPWAKSIAEISESLAIAMALVFLLIRPFLVQAFYIPSESMVPTLLNQDHILVNKMVYRFREPGRGDVVVFKAPLRATPEVASKAEVLASERGLDGSERAEFVSKWSKAHETDFIKRVVGVPGDTVRISRGYILIDNVEYDRDAQFLRDIVSQFRQGGGISTIRFVKDGILVDGSRLVTKKEIAAVLDRPQVRVEVHPGVVYINNKPMDEPYIAEDPADPYPTEDPNRAGYEVDQPFLVNDRGELSIKIPEGKLLVMGDNRNNSNDARAWGLLERERVLGKAMFRFWPLNRLGLVR